MPIIKMIGVNHTESTITPCINVPTFLFDCTYRYTRWPQDLTRYWTAVTKAASQ